MATGQSPRRPADNTASRRTDPPHELSSAIHEGEAAWEDLIGLFPPMRGARNIFDVDVDPVQTSCGFGVKDPSPGQVEAPCAQAAS